jgi:micrococcal nuclease
MARTRRLTKHTKTVNSIGRLLKLKSNQKAMLSVVVIIIAAVGYLFFDNNSVAPNVPTNNSQQVSNLREGIWYVSYVVDGDTIEVVDNMRQKYRIRFIGANAPETAKQNRPAEPYADKAKDFTKRMIAISKNQVRITFDGDKIDKYGRNLAMIYVKTPRGEIWLNEALITEGLARARVQYNYSTAAKERFKTAEQNAKKAKRNIWSTNF